MMCPYKVSSFDKDIEEKGSSFPLRLQGVRVRPVTVADVQKCYKLLNIQDQPIKDLRESIVNLFHYVCSFKFDTIKAIDDFCQLLILSMRICLFMKMSSRSATSSTWSFQSS